MGPRACPWAVRCALRSVARLRISASPRSRRGNPIRTRRVRAVAHPDRHQTGCPRSTSTTGPAPCRGRSASMFTAARRPGTGIQAGGRYRFPGGEPVRVCCLVAGCRFARGRGLREVWRARVGCSFVIVDPGLWLVRGQGSVRGEGSPGSGRAVPVGASGSTVGVTLRPPALPHTRAVPRGSQTGVRTGTWPDRFHRSTTVATLPVLVEWVHQDHDRVQRGKENHPRVTSALQQENQRRDAITGRTIRITATERIDSPNERENA